MKGEIKGKLDAAALARFEAAVRVRLENGAALYGDKSFARSIDSILAELQDEAADLAGWGFVLWRRIERLRAAVAEMGAAFK